jgi:hypothetical protein
MTAGIAGEPSSLLSAATVVPPFLRESPQFRRFWLGQTVSLLGDQVSLIAPPLVAVS